jgi:hypothetical protein
MYFHVMRLVKRIHSSYFITGYQCNVKVINRSVCMSANNGGSQLQAVLVLEATMSGWTRFFGCRPGL